MLVSISYQYQKWAILTHNINLQLILLKDQYHHYLLYEYFWILFSLLSSLSLSLSTLFSQCQCFCLSWIVSLFRDGEIWGISNNYTLSLYSYFMTIIPIQQLLPFFKSFLLLYQLLKWFLYSCWLNLFIQLHNFIETNLYSYSPSFQKPNIVLFKSHFCWKLQTIN